MPRACKKITSENSQTLIKSEIKKLCIVIAEHIQFCRACTRKSDSVPCVDLLDGVDVVALSNRILANLHLLVERSGVAVHSA